MDSRLSQAVIDNLRIVTGDGSNTAPVAENDSAVVDEDDTVRIDVLANDGDPQNDALSTRVVTGPAHGSLELLADGSYRYTPDADFHGDDSFSYVANDGALDSALATVAITVQPVNDVPTVRDHDFDTDEDTALDVSVADGVLVGVADPDGGDPQAALVQGPQHGSLTLRADGSFRYTPDADFHGQDSFTYKVSDGLADSAIATARITIAAVNDLPTLDALDDIDLDEGQTLDVTAIASDVDGDTLAFELLLAPDGADIDANGRILWTALDGDATALFTVRVSDPSGAQATRSFSAHVANVPPMLGLAGPPVAQQGFAYTVLLDHADPGDDTITEWVIDWGDGSESVLAGDATQASHVYDTQLGATRIQALARDEDGDWTGPLLDIDVVAMPLQVLSFTPDCDGFSVRFNQAFDQDQLNLVGLGRLPGDVLLQGASGGAVDGSLLIDADGKGFSFLKTGTPLSADSYTVTIRSGAQALTSASGDLDGDGDGIPGDDFTAVYSVNPPTQIRLGLPDFMRGPGQPIDVPIVAGGGLPVTLTSAGDVRSLQFEIRYDPALLQITDASGGSGLPAGATLDVDLSQPGLARISIASPGLLPAGALELVKLAAMVPFDATYQARHRVDIAAVTINDTLVECADDDALHIVGYIGDVNANMTYEIEDVQMIQRTAIRMNTGFPAWDDISPLIIADIDGNGRITSTDASRVYQELAGYDSALIPDIPSPEAFRIAAAQRATQQQPPAPATAAPPDTASDTGTEGDGDGPTDPPSQTADGGSPNDPAAPAVRFNSGLLDFGIGKPVSSNDWLLSWVSGSSRPAGNDWTVRLP
jgi:VCBS repeat-containing protein